MGTEDISSEEHMTQQPGEATKVLVTFTKQVCDDIDADLSYLTDKNRYKNVSAKEAAKCRAEDKARLAAFNRGEWHMLGIRAVAKIEIHRPGYIVHYELESPGLWGIESDSEERYFDEVFREECETLKRDIQAIVAGPITWPDSGN